MAELVADVAVVGAGPAGIAAATRAAELGKRVIVLDESPRAGGQIWRHREPRQLPQAAQRWIARFERSGAVFMPGVTVADVTADQLRCEQKGAALFVRASATVFCVGARERFLPFPGWTLPGVVGAGGAQALVKAGLEVRGKRAVVAGSGPLLFPVAALLTAYGAQVQLVAEQTPLHKMIGFAAGLWRTPAKWLEGARYRAQFRRARLRTNAWVSRAEGQDHVERAVLSDGRKSWSVPCDLLCVGYGLVPASELLRLAGCTVDHTGFVVVDALQQTAQPNVYCAGETTGIAGVDAALVEGEIAGLAAAGARAQAQPLLARRDAYRAFAGRLVAAFALRPELNELAEPGTIVCRCEDVRYEELAALGSAREAKLYTRAGMGPCQGRVCGAALQQIFGWSADTVRVPVVPVSVGTMAETN